MAASNGDQVNLVVKWAGKEYPIDNLPLSSTVQQLKSAIHAKTNVLPTRQKLLNLRFKGKAPSDEQCLNHLRLVNHSQFPSAMGWRKKPIPAGSIKQIFLSDIRTT